MSEIISTPGIYKITAGPNIQFGSVASPNSSEIDFTASIIIPPPPPVVAGLIRYVKNLFNPAVGLCAVSKSITGSTGVTFNWMNGSPGPNLPGWQTYLPFENWKYALGLWGLDATDTTAAAIFATLEKLKTEVNWVAPWNDECFLGKIVPFQRNDTNIIFTADKKGGSMASLPIDSTGKPYIVVQAAPWDYNMKSWKAPAGTEQGSLAFTWAQEQADQAMNWFYRGNLANAKACFQQFANQAKRLSDGAIAFGPAPYRGIYLGMFLQCAAVIGLDGITMPESITTAEVLATATAVQNTDGGIAWQYSGLKTFTHSIDEATNALLCALSPGVITLCQQAAGKYTVTSVPDLVPNLSLP